MVIQQPAPIAPPPPLPPSAPTPSALPGGPVAGVSTFSPNDIPRTRQELSALRARRSELSDQLNSASSRRSSLAQRLRSREGPADGADRAGLEQHLRVLDSRILQLESDIAVTGQQLAATPASLLGGSTRDFRGGGGYRAERDSAFGGFAGGMLLAFAIVFARRFWRRDRPAAQPRESTESVQRLMRLETAVDSIAIEMERVSEGQRFVTRLLSESQVVPRFDPARETAPALPVTRD